LQCLRATAGSGPVLILTHENPDPDALSSGKALATLLREAWGIQSRLVYSGLVGRAENKVMLGLLTPEWEQVDILENFDHYTAVALVDTQPGSATTVYQPESLRRSSWTTTPRFHLPWERCRASIYARRSVATVSLVYLYLQAAGVEPDAELANAIFYGIQTDTRGLSRGDYPIDQPIYFRLLHMIDREKYG